MKETIKEKHRIIKSGEQNGDRFELLERESMNGDYTVIKISHKKEIETLYASSSIIKASTYFNDIFIAKER